MTPLKKQYSERYVFRNIYVFSLSKLVCIVHVKCPVIDTFIGVFAKIYDSAAKSEVFLSPLELFRKNNSIILPQLMCNLCFILPIHDTNNSESVGHIGDQSQKLSGLRPIINLMPRYSVGSNRTH